MNELRVLLVEDESHIAQHIRRTLQKLGYAVLPPVPSGEEAVQKAGALRPDVVLMDVRLSGEMDGVAAAEQVQRRWDIPVVYLTARADDDFLQRAKLTAPFGYVHKPFQPKELHVAIEMALYKHELEKRLKESERRYRQLVESLQEGIWVIDREARTTYVNPRMAEMLGYTADEMQGQRLFSFMDPDHVAVCERHLARREQEIQERHAFEFQHKKGQPVWVSMATSPLTDEEGNYTGAIAAVQDITERKRAREAAQASQTRYEQLFQSMTSGVAVYQAIEDGEDFIFQDVNPASERIEGLAKKEVVGKRVTEVFPGVKDFGLFTVFQEVWRTGAPQYFPAAFYRDERIVGWRENHVYRLSSGEIVAIYNDITKRMQAREALRESEAKFRALFKILPVGVSILDREKKVVDANPVLERILELSRQELLEGAYTGRRYIHPDGTEMSPQAFPSARAAREQRVVENVEIGIVREGRETIWINVSAAPVDLPGWSVLITTSDITRRKRIETKLQQQTRALRRERDLLDRVTETSPVGITVLNCEGQITFANARAQEILGLSRDEITARAYNAPAWHITDYDGVLLPDEALPFRRVISAGKPVYDVRHAIQWPDGRRVLLSVNAAPLFDESGRVDGVVSAIEDVTGRVQEERRRREQLERELYSLDLLSAPAPTAVTAQSFGMVPLREGLPRMFNELTQEYGELIDLALEQRGYKVEHPVSEGLQSLAQRLGALKGGPRDVVDLHSAALRAKIQDTNPIKARTYAEEARLLALELMGYLTSYYRKYAIGTTRTRALGSSWDGPTKGDRDAP